MNRMRRELDSIPKTANAGFELVYRGAQPTCNLIFYFTRRLTIPCDGVSRLVKASRNVLALG